MIVITGAKGQLGFDIEKACINRSLDVMGIDRSDLDITDKKAVDCFFKNKKFDTLIHCAAFTAVDLAEDESALCYNVNTQATINLANACKEYNVKLVLISTDYVFDGTKEGFYDVNDQTSAQSVYGKSKADAEAYIQEILVKYFIIRISWVFGLNGKNFIRTMINLGKTKDEISVVSDQVGSPTYTKDVAKLIIDIAMSEKYGIYHATNEGECSWADLASYVFTKLDYKTNIKYILTKEYKTKAIRPLNSRLSKDKLDKMGFTRLPSWQDAVDRYLIELKEEGINMKLEKTLLDGLYIIHTDVFGDHRGWFTESYSYKKYKDLGINTNFIQDNHSYSKEKGTLRGLHFQTGEFAQSKLVRCTKGKILDICVDLRRKSSTYLKYICVELSDINNLQLFVPKGFAHGFVTLVDDVEIMYKVDAYYSKEHDSGVRFDDPDININWKELVGDKQFIISSKDEQLGFIKDMDIVF